MSQVLIRFLIGGAVDGSFIMANASHHSRIPREQLTEAAQVNYGARKYLEGLEQENGDGEPIHEQDKVSTTDTDSTYLTKGNRAAELGYFHNYLIDNESCVIVGVQATAARLSQESAAVLLVEPSGVVVRQDPARRNQSRSFHLGCRPGKKATRSYIGA